MRVFEALFGTHRWFDRNVDAFADGELREGARTRFEQHMQRCERCQATVRQAQGVKSLIANMPEMPVTRSFAITESMLTRPSAPAASHRRDLTAPLRAIQGLGAGAVALFAVLVVVDVGGGGSGSLATPSSDFDAAATVAEDSGGSPAELAPAGGDDDSDAGAAGGLDDASDGANPETTPGGVEGAGVEDPAPLPTPVPDIGGSDDPPAGQAEPADRSSDEPDPGDFETTALFADERDDGGIDWLRISQVASLAGAALAAVAYFALRRRVNADR